MRMRTVVFVLSSTAAYLAGCSSETGGEGGDPTAECPGAVESELVQLVNDERAAAGRGPLICDARLMRAAQSHSQDMCDHGFLSHNGSDGSSLAERAQREGASFRRLGENVAHGQTTPQEVMSSWMSSAGHRENILGFSFAKIGIGYVECAGSRPYWTQVFSD